MAKLKKSLFIFSLFSFTILAENFVVRKVKQQTTDGLHEAIGQLIGDSLEMRSKNLQSAGAIQQKEIEVTKAIIDEDDQHYIMQADKRALRRFKKELEQFETDQCQWREIQQKHAQFLDQFEKELVIKKNKKILKKGS